MNDIFGIPLSTALVVLASALALCLIAVGWVAWRRPVMKTYAPSATKRFAVARPMPLLPPVMRAIFPDSLSDMLLIPLTESSEGITLPLSCSPQALSPT